MSDQSKSVEAMMTAVAAISEVALASMRREREMAERLAAAEETARAYRNAMHAAVTRTERAAGYREIHHIRDAADAECRLEVAIGAAADARHDQLIDECDALRLALSNIAADSGVEPPTGKLAAEWAFDVQRDVTEAIAKKRSEAAQRTSDLLLVFDALSLDFSKDPALWGHDLVDRIKALLDECAGWRMAFDVRLHGLGVDLPDNADPEQASDLLRETILDRFRAFRDGADELASEFGVDTLRIPGSVDNVKHFIESVIDKVRRRMETLSRHATARRMAEGALCEIAAEASLGWATTAEVSLFSDAVVEDLRSEIVNWVRLSRPADELLRSQHGRIAPLPAPDLSRPARERGLEARFRVERVDGRDLPGGDREGADYLVLDIKHDPLAVAAAMTYGIEADVEGYHLLAVDIRNRIRRYQPDRFDKTEVAVVAPRGAKLEEPPEVEPHAEAAGSTFAVWHNGMLVDSVIVNAERDGLGKAALNMAVQGLAEEVELQRELTTNQSVTFDLVLGGEDVGCAVIHASYNLTLPDMPDRDEPDDIPAF